MYQKNIPLRRAATSCPTISNSVPVLFGCEKDGGLCLQDFKGPLNRGLLTLEDILDVMRRCRRK